MNEKESDRFDVYAVIELLGHRRLIGRVTEQEIAGAGFLRIDVLGGEDEIVQTQFVAPGSVYCITPVAEEAARLAGRGNAPEPITVWELPEKVREAVRQTEWATDPAEDPTFADPLF